MNILKKCKECKNYTLKNNCSHCKKETLNAHYKFIKIRNAPKQINKK